MAEQLETKFTWVLENFSSSLHEVSYSPPFAGGDCNWCLLAYPMNGGLDRHLSVYLILMDHPSLPLGWKKEVKLDLTLVNKRLGRRSEVLGGQCCFDAEHKYWGYTEFVSLTKLHAREEGFLFNDSLTIVAELKFLDHVVLPQPEDTTNFIDFMGVKEASDALFIKSVGDSFCLIPQETENTSKESLDDDEDSDKSEESSVDDDVCWDHASSSVSEDRRTEQVKSPEEETINVNGFEVCSSQVVRVSHIFERHPDLALGFRPKNQKIRRVYMNQLLGIIETICQSPENISEDDLRNADETLVDLVDVGFKLDWLKTKVDEVYEKKKMEEDSVARIQTMEFELEKMQMMFLDLVSKLEKEKTEALASRDRPPLSFNDVVC